MLRQIRECYDTMGSELTLLQDEFGELVQTGKLRSGCRQRGCRRIVVSFTRSSARTPWHIRAWDGENPHFVADRAKYYFAVLIYRLAMMQYSLAELAGTGRLDRDANEDLQFVWFSDVFTTVYNRTVMAVIDQRY